MLRGVPYYPIFSHFLNHFDTPMPFLAHKYTRSCGCEVCELWREEFRAKAQKGMEANVAKARLKREAGGKGGQRKRKKRVEQGEAEKAVPVVVAAGRTVKERLEGVQERLLHELEDRVGEAKLGTLDVGEIEKLLKAVREGLVADAALEFGDAGRALQVVVGMPMEEEGDEPPTVQ